MSPWSAPAEDVADYLRQIAQHPLLTAEEEVELGRQMESGRRAARELTWDAGTPQRRAQFEQLVEQGKLARQRMIESNLRLVVSIARRYVGHGLSLPDLIQEGNIGLQIGVDKFEWRRGFRLSTYVYWWIRQAVTRAVANDGRMIRLPVHLGERLHQAAHVEQRLRADLGREPTLAEVAMRVGLGPERLHALRLAASPAASLDAPADPTTSLTRGELLPDDAAGPEVQAITELDELAVLVAVALERLSPREREVVRLRYGLGRSETWNLAQIGARLGLTRERARQLEDQALRKLRNDVRLWRALVDFCTD